MKYSLMSSRRPASLLKGLYIIEVDLPPVDQHVAFVNSFHAVMQVLIFIFF